MQNLTGASLGTLMHKVKREAVSHLGHDPHVGTR